MNFLAHLHLSGDDPGWLLGGILGDFVRGTLTPNRFPEPVQNGIVLHRRIDALTDAHPVWRSSKSFLTPERRRFAGIIIDVIYDHFLARHWNRFSQEPFDRWVPACYRSLQKKIIEIQDYNSDPTANFAEAREVIEEMTDGDWFTSYLDRDGISDVLERISHRSPRLAGMGGSGDEFLRHYHELEIHFLKFYPDVISFANQFRRQTSQEQTLES